MHDKIIASTFLQGAPERILDLCGLALVESSEVGMDFDVKAKINEEYLRLASLGERVLGIFLFSLKL